MKNQNVIAGVVGVALLAGGIYLGKAMGGAPAATPVNDPTTAGTGKNNVSFQSQQQHVKTNICFHFLSLECDFAEVLDFSSKCNFAKLRTSPYKQ